MKIAKVRDIARGCGTLARHLRPIPLPRGTPWPLHAAAQKLAYRAQLPGARVYDLVGRGLRAAAGRGVSDVDRLMFALPASWLVNSPAVSKVLRRWALPPHDETCLALIEVLQSGPDGWAEDVGTAESVRLALASLGDEPYVTEAVSKVMALIVPDVVPLMPGPARAFVLGDAGKDAPGAFMRIVEWFARAVIDHRGELEAIALVHRVVELTAGGVLDRLLWFDSEGHRHFPPIA
jgi:hypothetical protein